MMLSPGTRLGPYEVVAPLGAGGMGEVFRARDARLGRDVAIKALPPAFAQDPERLARFEREARLLATLQHPNIAGIHGLEEVEGQRYLVLEFVDGETLAQRIRRGALPLDDALDVCRQVAAALESAHESGVVHRDLKPGNVMLTKSGGVKVLDFGLAKGGSGDPSGSSPELSASPTLTHAATAAGVILGTAAYMSPEQARGKAVDRRTDIWSFGCVLYECVAGRPVFEGETVSDIIARILEREADWSALPERTPERVRALLRRCLEKDARRRLRDIGEARIELDDLHAARLSGAALAAAPAAVPNERDVRARGGVLALLGIAAAAFGLGLLVRPALQRSSAPATVTFEVSSPKPFDVAADAAQSAISPDGTMLAFVAQDSTRASLWVRDLKSPVARPLEGTDQASFPFWSPDSRSIGFFTDTHLARVPAAGGPVDVICDVKRARGGTWNRDNVIVFAPTSDGPLSRVNAGGGDPQPVTTLDIAHHESGQRFPCFLPDGRHFLYASLPRHQGRFDIVVGSLDGRERKRVTDATTGAVYAAPGYLLFQRTNTIVAQAFDAGSQRVRGEPVLLRLATGNTDFASAPGFSASANGALAFVRPQTVRRRCAWFDRRGHEIASIALPPAAYEGGSLSLDGRRAALMIEDAPGENTLELADIERGTLVRLSEEPGSNEAVYWSRDGRRVAYQNNNYGPQRFIVRTLDGSSTPRSYLDDDPMFKTLEGWSPDGQSLVFTRQDPQTRADLYVLSLATGRATPYLRTAANEDKGRISPDGRWMLYESDETGRYEAYVQAYPNAGGKTPLTSGGGVDIDWSEDGRHVLFLESDKPGRAFMADVLPGSEFRIGPTRDFMTIAPHVAPIGATPDLERLFCLVDVGEPPPPAIEVVLGWRGLLSSR